MAVREGGHSCCWREGCIHIAIAHDIEENAGNYERSRQSNQFCRHIVTGGIMSRLARPVDALKDYLEVHCLGGDDVLVAFSGGPDSTALLLALSELNGPRRPVYACWIDHALRSVEEIAAERSFVEGFCLRLGASLAVRQAGRGELEAEASMAGGVEAAARRFRYRMLEEVRSGLGLKAILTAHHADDVRETRIMRFFSGSGAAGLAGIPEELGKIGRPFLRIDRGELLSWLDLRGQPYRIDSTNEGADYLRNLVRRELVPVVARIFPGFAEALDAGAWKAHDDETALAGYAKELLGPHGVPIDLFREAPQAVRERALFLLADKALAETERADARVSWRLVRAAALQALRMESTGQTRCLAEGSGLTFILENGEVGVRERSEARPAGHDFNGFSLIAHGPGMFRIGKARSCRLYCREESGHLRMDAFSWPLVVRSRRPGDAIQTSGGRKNIDRLLSELRVRVDQRKSVPILEDAKGIVAVLGSFTGARDRFRRNDLLVGTQAPGFLTLEMKGVAENDAARR
ncbi:MAG: tRNA lysidine(34) synthetase TilS [Spirochaetales bacterium]|nr:MAG: tRNA lysidine(34) synthetase TilS [Spirochaetales bacterium]